MTYFKFGCVSDLVFYAQSTIAVISGQRFSNNNKKPTHKKRQQPQQKARKPDLFLAQVTTLPAAAYNSVMHACVHRWKWRPLLKAHARKSNNNNKNTSSRLKAPSNTLNKLDTTGNRVYIMIYFWWSLCTSYLVAVGESYRKRLRPFLLCLCDACPALITSLVC